MVRDADIQNIAMDRPPHKLSGQEMMRVVWTQHIDETHMLQRTTPRNIAPILIRSPVSIISAEPMEYAYTHVPSRVIMMIGIVGSFE